MKKRIVLILLPFVAVLLMAATTVTPVRNLINSTITASASNQTALTIVGSTNQTNHLLVFQNSAGVLQSYFGSNGSYTIPRKEVATNDPGISVAQEWNDAGETIAFDYIKVGITNQKSGSGGNVIRVDVHNTGAANDPNFINCLYGGSSKWRVDSIGAVYQSELLQLPSGTASTPSLRFAAGQGGLYAPAISNISLSLGGVARVHFLPTSVDVQTNMNIKGQIIATNGVAFSASATALTNALGARASLDFPDTAAQTHSDLSVTVTGTTTNDVAQLGVPFQAVMNGADYSCFTSNDAVWVRFVNASSSAKNPAAATFTVLVTKF